MSTVHRPDCLGNTSSRIDHNCERCREYRVHELDNERFSSLMGCTREEFDAYVTLLASSVVPGAPRGLHNFYDVIMNANALKVQTERDYHRHV